MKKTLISLGLIAPTFFLSSCTFTEITTPGYAAVAYSSPGYYSNSPFGGDGFGFYNGFGYDNGWYGTQNYYGAVVFSSDW